MSLAVWCTLTITVTVMITKKSVTELEGAQWSAYFHHRPCPLTLTFKNLITSTPLVKGMTDEVWRQSDVNWRQEVVHKHTLYINQLVKIHNSSLDTSHSAGNFGFILYERLTLSDQITSLSKACYYHIRQLRCIRPYSDSSLSSACTVPIG